MGWRDVILDTWAPLSHKAWMGSPAARNGGTGTDVAMAPTWVPEADKRRLDAYRIERATVDNCARFFLPVPTPRPMYDASGRLMLEAVDDDRDTRREYGDAELLVMRLTAGVLGDNPTWVVPGADDELSDEPRIPRRPITPKADEGESVDPLETRVFDARMKRWKLQAAAAVEEWEKAWDAQPALQERQEWLRQWSEDERVTMKLVESEGDAIPLGDWVLVMGWDPAKRRAALQVWDPGFYFPVLDDNPSEDFPTRVHLAWEWEDDAKVKWVRRITYSLGPIRPQTDEDGFPLFDDAGALMLAGANDVLDPQRGITRRYPWQTSDEDPSTTTCYMTDASWNLGEVAARWDAFSPSKARYAFDVTGRQVRDLDLGIDFLPVIHCPNSAVTREHWGRSALANVFQLLDDISSADTDVATASALTAGPVIGLSGASPDLRVAVTPGTIYGLGENGKMDVLDLSKGLETLKASVEALRDLLSVNGKVPGEMLGRVQASEVKSGVQLALAMGPFGQVAETMRMVRRPRWALIPKFAQRLAMAAGEDAGGLPAGETMDAELVPGSYLPSDLGQAVDQAVALLTAHGMSRPAALRHLRENGMKLGDLADELAQIEREDFDGAKSLADATGSEQAAADYLRVELPEPDPATAAPPPGAPGVVVPGQPPTGGARPPAPAQPPAQPAPRTPPGAPGA